MRYLIFLAAVVVVLQSSCCKCSDQMSSTVVADSIILQAYGGMIPIREAFLISRAGVKADTTRAYNDTLTAYHFGFSLPEATAAYAVPLLSKVPSALLLENAPVLGLPKFEVDGTAKYLVLFIHGKRYSYIIADDISSLPGYLQPFETEVQQVFQQLVP